MEPRGRLIPMFRRTAAQPSTEDPAIDAAPSLDSPGPEEAGANQAAPEWGPVKRLLFRFACVYLVLYSFPFPLGYMPYIDVITVVPYQKLQDAVVLWTGKQVFQTDIEIFRPNGSGDATYNYVLAFSFLAFSVAAALVWTLLDRKRRNYERLYEWLRIYVRFVLATSMISYGAYKVIPSQFPAPSLDRLLQPFGDASPMGLLWTFIGASTAYNIFGGVSEMLGGLLLTFRRTTLLGALVCSAVLTNVVMLNFSYDVPVKLYSAHLLLMAVFLTLPDLRRLANLLVLNRTVEPAKLGPLFQRKWLDRSALVLRTVLVAALTIWMLRISYTNYQEYGATAPKPPLYGIWEVDELVVDGQVRPPLVTDEDRWRRVVFSYPGMIAVQLMSGSRQRFRLELDEKKKTMALTKRDDEKWKSALTYKQPGPELLVMEGTFDGKKLRARMHKVDKPTFLLTSRGFHWINERPFNR